MTIPLTLADTHREQLEQSRIDARIIDARGYVTAWGPEPIKEREGRFSSTQIPKKTKALFFPAYRLGEPTPYAWILRPDSPRKTANGKNVKYEWPAKVPTIMDVLPMYRDALKDPSKPIWFTEGAKKADALASAFGDEIVPVNLNGVYGWRTRKDALHKATASLSDLDEVPWQGRLVVLAFDSDVRYNHNIQDALARLGRLLAARGARVQILMLPQEKDGPKVGVDDFLLAGHTAAEFSAHLTDAQEAAAVGRRKIGRHPDTNEDLYFPPGFIDNHNHIATEENGRVSQVYRGRLLVTAIGVDAATGEESLEVLFDKGNGARVVKVVAPRIELATGQGVLKHLGRRGAPIHDTNSKKVARFLIEFVAENEGAIPERQFSAKLGNLSDGTLVTPIRSIGGQAQYTGPHTSRAGQDPDAYVRAVQEISHWPGAWPLWVTLGFNLASPFMGRIGVRRNPVVYLAGDSNSGKTSTANFAQGVWVEPGRHPYAIQGSRTTEAGIKQTFQELNGLPVVLDEAHTVRHTDILEGAVYGFANRQGYTTGGRDGRSRGGVELSGSFILTGEAVAEFKFAGSRNRVLYLDTATDPPLGTDAPRGSAIGAERSATLEDAWMMGAGHLGPRVADSILGNWGEFVDTVQAMKLNLAALADWADPCAVMMATLGVMFEELGVAPPTDIDALPEHIARAMQVARTQNPAHKTAWEELTTLIAQADQRDILEGFPGLYVRGELIGWGDTTYIYVLNNSEAFKNRVGKSATQLHGQRWIEAGWIAAARDGKATQVTHLKGSKVSVRVLQVKRSALQTVD